MEYNADLQVKDSQQRYPVHWACAHKKRDCLEVDVCLLDAENP